MHRSEGLLDFDNFLKHGTRFRNTIYAALYGVEPQTSDSPEDSALRNIYLGRTVS